MGVRNGRPPKENQRGGQNENRGAFFYFLDAWPWCRPPRGRPARLAARVFLRQTPWARVGGGREGGPGGGRYRTWERIQILQVVPVVRQANGRPLAESYLNSACADFQRRPRLHPISCAQYRGNVPGFDGWSHGVVRAQSIAHRSGGQGSFACFNQA